MERSYGDLRVSFICDVAGRNYLAYALCRADAQRLLAQQAGVDDGKVFARRFPEGDAWIRKPDLQMLAQAAGFIIVGPEGVQPARRPPNSVDDELQLRQEAVGHWPRAEVIGVRQLEGVVQVHLLFDGGRHAFWLPDAGEVLIAPVDKPAWLAFCGGSGAQDD